MLECISTSSLTGGQLGVDSGPVPLLYLDVGTRLTAETRLLPRRHYHVRLRNQHLEHRLDVFCKHKQTTRDQRTTGSYDITFFAVTIACDTKQTRRYKLQQVNCL